MSVELMVPSHTFGSHIDASLLLRPLFTWKGSVRLDTNAATPFVATPIMQVGSISETACYGLAVALQDADSHEASATSKCYATRDVGGSSSQAHYLMRNSDVDDSIGGP